MPKLDSTVNKIAQYFYEKKQTFTMEDIKNQVFPKRKAGFYDALFKALEMPGKKYRITVQKFVENGELNRVFRVKGLANEPLSGAN